MIGTQVGRARRFIKLYSLYSSWNAGTTICVRGRVIGKFFLSGNTCFCARGRGNFSVWHYLSVCCGERVSFFVLTFLVLKLEEISCGGIEEKARLLERRRAALLEREREGYTARERERGLHI